MVSRLICSLGDGLICLLNIGQCFAICSPQGIQDSDPVSKQEVTNETFEKLSARLGKELEAQLESLLKKKLRGPTIRPPLKETKMEMPEWLRSEMLEQHPWHKKWKGIENIDTGKRFVKSNSQIIDS